MDGMMYSAVSGPAWPASNHMAGSSWRIVELNKDNLKVVQGCGGTLQMYPGELLASSNCNRNLLPLSASRAQEVSVTHAIFIPEKDHREANVIIVALSACASIIEFLERCWGFRGRSQFVQARDHLLFH